MGPATALVTLAPVSRQRLFGYHPAQASEGDTNA
jgi:hypothetical protein